MTKYRIVTDSYAGYECQIWRWWWPFWTQMSQGNFNTNTFPSLESAKGFIEKYQKVVWQSNK